MKKLLSLILAVVLILSCLAGLCFAADPIAEVTNGTEVKTATNREEIKALINPDGTTVIKMLKDYTVNEDGGFLYQVPTCTLDLDGHTLTLTAKNHAVFIDQLGTKNTVTTIKNGTVIAQYKVARIDKGTLYMENIRGYSHVDYTVCFGQLETEGVDTSIITGSYLVNAKHPPVAYGVENWGDHTACKVKVENSVLINAKTPGALVLGGNGGTVKFGTVELGKSVVIMTRNYRFVNTAKMNVIGETAEQVSKSSESMDIPQLNMSVEEMHRWETPKGDFAYTPEAAAVEIADFADVAKDFWGYEAIMNAAKAGLVKGKSENADGTFNYVPNAAMTRAEFITVICRYFYPDEAMDVTAGEKWWTGYYDMAIDKEFLMASELDGGELDKAMTREEMALVLSRTAPAQKAYETVTPADSAKIPDYASVGADYQTAVLWAYGAGLLKGVDANGTFNPQGELNRAAVATIFNSLLSSK